MPNAIETITKKLQADFGLTPVVACEIEFYLYDKTPQALELFWQELMAACKAHAISVFNYEQEKGEGQFEVALGIAPAAKAATDCKALKELITLIAERHAMCADFSAKPSPDQPGSGLHVHVHLEDESGKNVFYKDDECMSDALRYSLGGLLAELPRSMAIFAPTEDSKKRFVGKTNAPTTISWGANNRTTALRLPDSAKDNKRIEHRVAGSDADPAAVIAVILEAMCDGLRHKTDPGPQIYGDAADAQYGLRKLLF